MTYDLTPLIAAAAPYVAAAAAAIVAIIVSYLKTKLNVSPALLDQLRTFANEGINSEVNKVIAASSASSATKVNISNELIGNVVGYVTANAGSIVKATGYTPDKLTAMVTSLMIAHPAVDTPLVLTNSAQTITVTEPVANSDAKVSTSTTTSDATTPTK